MRFSRSLIGLLVMLAVLGSGCGAGGSSSKKKKAGAGGVTPSIHKPDGIAGNSGGKPKSASMEGLTVTRYDLSSQGGGTATSASGRLGFVSRNSSIGGSYVKRTGAQSESYQLNAGLHGNPRARK